MENTNKKYSKWVSCWGNATSITDRKETTYAKDLTLRYPIEIPFSGDMLRFRFSNLTGTEPITIRKANVARKNDFKKSKRQITFNNGEEDITIMPGQEKESDEIHFNIEAYEEVAVSFYLEGFTL